MQREQACHPGGLVQDGDEADLALLRVLHLLQRVDGLALQRYGARVPAHQLGDRAVQGGGAHALHPPPEVPVGEGPQEAALLVDHEDAPAALLGELHQHLHHLGPGQRGGDAVARVHHVGHLQEEALPDAARRVVLGVRVPGEALLLHHGDRDGVPEEQLDGRRGHRRQVEGAELALQREHDGAVAGPGELRARQAGHAHEPRAAGLGEGHEPEELLRGPALGEEHEDVVLADDPDVPVQRVHGVQEDGLGARGHQRHGDLLGDEAALAHPREKHHPLALQHVLRAGGGGRGARCRGQAGAGRRAGAGAGARSGGRASERRVGGRKCFENLSDIDDEVDMVDVFRKDEFVYDVTKEAIKINAKVLWTQLDIFCEDSFNLAKDAGLKVVMDKCPKIELEH